MHIWSPSVSESHTDGCFHHHSVCYSDLNFMTTGFDVSEK